MRYAFLVLLAVAALIYEPYPRNASAATFTVTNADDSGLGSLRQAMLDANGAVGADTIVFDGVFFATPRTITILSNLPVISTPMTITGPGVNNLTLSALGCVGCNLLVVNASLTVSGLTLSGATNGGLVSLGTTTADNIAITGNTIGGGLQVLQGTTTIRNSTISNNSSTGNGGGIRLQTGSLNVLASTLSGNTATDDGGGLWANNPWSTENATVSGNTASRGGGIFVTSSGFPNVGGGISHGTVFENTATNGSAGSALHIMGAQVGTVNVVNSILAQGASGSTPVCAAASNSFSVGGNIFGDASCMSILGSGADRHSLNLPLGALAFIGGPTRTHLPPAGSPAIDTGNVPFCLPTDQRGLPRPADGDNNGTSICDVGAVEVQPGPPAVPPTITKSFSPSTITSGSTATLSVTITNPNAAPLTGVGFTDNFPAGMATASPPALTNTCGGTVTGFVAGAGQVSLANGTVAANSSCTVSVSVMTNGAGTFPNSTGPVASSAGAGAAASATLQVNPVVAVTPPAIAKSFSPTMITSGGTSRLTLTFTNPNVDVLNANVARAAVQLTNVSVSDTLPAGMTVAATLNVAQTCGGSTIVNATPGGNAITVTGGVLASGASCTVSVNVMAVGNSVLTNTTGTVSAQESGAGGTATAQLTVQGGVVSPTSSTPVPTVVPTSTPVVSFVPAIIPQGVQNPAAILAVQGGIGNGTRNNTPVPARPAVIAPSTSAMPVITPPSTGDGGLR